MYSYTIRSATAQPSPGDPGYNEIAEKRGWTRDQLDAEIAVRKNLLEEMKKQKIIDYISVASIFHNYHIRREEVLANSADLRQVLR